MRWEGQGLWKPTCQALPTWPDERAKKREGRYKQGVAQRTPDKYTTPVVTTKLVIKST
jgi:hypothetical protein